MTNRNRRSRRTSQPRRRTGRNVWVNEHFNILLSIDNINAVNLLAAADNFMTFDTTIVEVIMPVLAYEVRTDATIGTRQIRWALQVAPSTFDVADFETLYADSIGPPWMQTGGDAFKTAAVGDLNLSLTVANGGPIRAKASRRFRENDSTLWLILENRSNAGDSSLTINGFSRTLIRIP